MNCENCDQPALWVYDVPSTDNQNYCDEHLPSFLRAQARSGVLPTTEVYEKVKADVAAALAPEAPVKKSVKKSAVVEDAPVEEDPAEA